MSKGSLKHGVRALFLVIGLSIVGTLAYSLGPGEIWRQTQNIGWGFPLIFVPYGLLFAFDTTSWSFAFRPGWLRGRVRIGHLYLVRLAGESVNNVTPTAYLGGEPVKALLLKRFGIPVSEGLASVVIAKTTLASSQILFMFAGAVVLVFRTDSQGGLVWGLLLAVPLAIAFVGAIVAWQRYGLFAPIVRLAKGLGFRSSRLDEWEAKSANVDGKIRFFYSNYPRRFFVAAAFNLVAWTIGVAEVVVVLSLMGVPFTWWDAFIIESLAQFARGIGGMFPGSIGVQEGGGVVIFEILEMDRATGFALMLLKRVRELVFTGCGLLLVSYFGVGKQSVDEDAAELPSPEDREGND